MQEQLKAHQLEELVHLQEEQQRLLGMVHVAQQDGAGTENTLTLLLPCHCCYSGGITQQSGWSRKHQFEFDTPDLDKTDFPQIT